MACSFNVREAFYHWRELSDARVGDVFVIVSMEMLEMNKINDTGLKLQANYQQSVQNLLAYCTFKSMVFRLAY